LKIGFGAGCGVVCCAAAEIANKNARTNRRVDEGTAGPPLFFFTQKLRAKYTNPKIVSASCSLEDPDSYVNECSGNLSGIERRHRYEEVSPHFDSRPEARIVNDTMNKRRICVVALPIGWCIGLLLAQAEKGATWGKRLSLPLLLCTITVFAAGQEFPLKKVPLLTHLVDYEAAWSPNGRQIVLISNRHGGMKVHILNASGDADGSEMQQITSGPNEDDSPAWSPDGRQIAFVSVHDRVSDIFIMNADGGDVRQVTHNLGQNIHPMWSPDGSRILFNTTFFGESTPQTDQASDEKRVIGEKRDDSIDLATIRPDGSDLQRITHGGGYTYASFSPDGKWILHRRQHGEVSQVFIMSSDGSGDHNVSGSSTLDGWPSWSPDGNKIVFSRHLQSGFQIFVMNRDGTRVRQLTDAPGEFVNPRWSPDGRRILCGRRLGGVSLAVFQAPM
jgi:TolB protein